MREQAADERAAKIERVVGEVAQQRAAEMGRPLAKAELEHVRTLTRQYVVGKTDA
jgi:hypothetical protein